VLDPVWRLYARAIEIAGPTATLLEWDDHIPTFDEVHAEALKAKKFLPAEGTRKTAHGAISSLTEPGQFTSEKAGL
jgi:uncharacterized protein (UPF0276 family)